MMRIDTASADREAGLAELLSDDVDRGVGIEEAVTDDLAIDFVGADGFGLGATFLVEERNGSMFLELFVNLIISLPREAVFVRRLCWPQTLALSLDEHEQSRCDLIIGVDEEFPGGADDTSFRKLIQHVYRLARRASMACDVGTELAGG